MDEQVLVSNEENDGQLPKAQPPNYQKWFFLGGAAVFLIWAIITSWSPAIIEPDINQNRRNITLPPPQETSQIRQTFTPSHDGLTEVEVTIARETITEIDGRFELQLLDESGQTITAESLNTLGLVHEQRYVLRFDPQPHSAGQTYTLLAAGSANNDVSLWGYDLDVHSGGELTFPGGETAAQDLYLITRYKLTLANALQPLWQALTSYGPLLLVALAYILMPGSLILVLWRTYAKKTRTIGRDLPTQIAFSLALGLSTWPLLWQFFSLLNIRWSPPALWIVTIGGWAITIILAFKTRQPTNQPNQPINSITQLPNYKSQITNYALLLLLTVSLATRFLAVRDQTFPPWVDASRHGLITAVMAQTGQVIKNYQPFLPVDRFPYHYGFHTISAGLIQLTSQPLTTTLLSLGQLLNALVPLSIYAAAYLLTRRRLAGLIAAFLVALPFFFPAYYATWGRMTQLTGVLVLPLLLALTWKLVRGPKGWRANWWLVSLLAAGLFLIHFRVFLLYLVYAGLVWLLSLGRNGRHLILTALATLLLVAPRIWNLLADTNPARAVSASIPGYNNFPTGYVTTGWEKEFLIMGGVAAFIALVGVVLRKQWAFSALFLVSWAGLTAVLLSGSRLGLPETSLININSAYIVLFVPLSLLLGIIIAQLWHMVKRTHWLVSSAVALIFGAAVCAATLFGIYRQITILNPETILAWPQDQAGLTWLDESTPPDAKVAVNAFHWLGTTWAGQDGGAWVVPLTARQSTTPPADYIYSPSLAVSVGEYNEMFSNWGNWADPLVADLLREQGVTHLFVGARGGFMDPAELAKNPEMTLLFGRDGVFVFALNPE